MKMAYCPDSFFLVQRTWNKQQESLKTIIRRRKKTNCQNKTNLPLHTEHTTQRVLWKSACCSSSLLSALRPCGLELLSSHIGAMEPLFKTGVSSHLNKNLGLWMQIMDAYGKREKTALGGCSHACF